MDNCEDCGYFESQIYRLELVVSDLESDTKEAQNQLTDMSYELRESEQKLDQEMQERAALEKDYDKQLVKLDDVSHDFVSMQSVAQRAGNRWRDHLEYLQEYWPEVITDMELRGDMKGL